MISHKQEMIREMVKRDLPHQIDGIYRPAEEAGRLVAIDGRFWDSFSSRCFISAYIGF